MCASPGPGPSVMSATIGSGSANLSVTSMTGDVTLLARPVSEPAPEPAPAADLASDPAPAADEITQHLERRRVLRGQFERHAAALFGLGRLAAQAQHVGLTQQAFCPLLVLLGLHLYPRAPAAAGSSSARSASLVRSRRGAPCQNSSSR